MKNKVSMEDNETMKTERANGNRNSILFRLLYIGIAAMILLLILVYHCIVRSKPVDQEAFFYAKDNELQLLPVSNLKSVEITEQFIGYDDGTYGPYPFTMLSNYIHKSDDKRYIFYPGRLEDRSTYYWRDLKANQGKRTATIVDSDINDNKSFLTHLTSDGDYFFYVKGDDDSLYVYSRKSEKKKQLDDNVTGFFVNEAGNYIIYSTNVDEESHIYELSLKNLSGERLLIDSNSIINKVYIEEKALYYTKGNTLYFKEFGKDKTEVASDVHILLSLMDTPSVYYLRMEEATLKLAELIQDDLAADDKNMVEPVYPDRPQEPQSDADNEAYTQYEIDYANWITEYNNYNIAYRSYQDKMLRDQLREALDSENNALVYEKYSLYYWEGGRETLLVSDIFYQFYDYYKSDLTISQDMPVVVYNKAKTSTGNLKLSELLNDYKRINIDTIISDLKKKPFRAVSKDTFIAVKDKESIIETDHPNAWSIDTNGTIYFLDNYNWDKGHGDLMEVSLSGDSVGKPVKIDEDVTDYEIGNGNNRIYYYKDGEKDEYGTKDLYIDGYKIASDVYTSSLYNYKGSDTLLYYKNYDRVNGFGTLALREDDEEFIIADQVKDFVPIDEMNIALLTNYNFDSDTGDLLLYHGSEQLKKIDTEVSHIIWNKDMIWENPYYLKH